MVQWSAFGNWLDYLTTKPDGHATLTLYSPGTGQMLTADTSGTTDSDFTPQVLWPSDGKHIAVLTPNYGPNDQLGHWGQIFWIDGGVFYKVTDNAAASLVFAGPGGPTTQFKWSADSHSLFYPQNLTTYDWERGLDAFNLDCGQAILLRSNIYLNLNMTDDQRYVLTKWGDAPNQKIDIVDTVTLQRIVTLPSLYYSIDRDSEFRDQVYGGYSPQSGWLIVDEDGINTWAVNIRTGVQRPLLPAFPIHVDQDQHGGASFTDDYRFVGGLKTYSSGQINSDYYVLSLDDGTFHDFHLPPSIVDPLLVDYSPDGEVTLSSIDVITNDTPISVLRSDSSIRRQFKVTANYTSIQRTNCAPNK